MTRGGRTDNEDLAALLQASGPERVPEVRGAADRLAVVLMRAGARWYAVAADSVREIVSLEAVTRVPAMPAHVLGVALVHGRLVPVVDLPRLVGVTTAGEGAPRGPRLVVLESGEHEVSVVADEARGVVHLPASFSESSGDRADFVRGELFWGEELVCLIAADRFVARATQSERAL